MSILRSFNGNHLVDGNAPCLINAELCAFDEVREVGLEEGLPRDVAPDLMKWSWLRSPISEHCNQTLEEADPLVVVGSTVEASEEPAGLGIGASDTEGAEQGNELVADEVNGSRIELGPKIVELFEYPTQRTRSTLPCQRINSILDGAGPCALDRRPPAKRDVLHESARRSREEEALWHLHIAGEPSRSVNGDDGDSRE